MRHTIHSDYFFGVPALPRATGILQGKTIATASRKKY